MLNTILLNARAQLQERAGVTKTESFARISRETGLTISWLQKFADGRIDNPTVASLDRLLSYFEREQHKSKREVAA